MSKLSESRIKANKKWDKENLDRISIVLKKGQKEIIKKCAAKKNVSVNAYINNAIHNQIREDTKADTK